MGPLNRASKLQDWVIAAWSNVLVGSNHVQHISKPPTQNPPSWDLISNIRVYQSMYGYQYNNVCIYVTKIM